MSKLLTLKKFLSFPDAIDHLSTTLEEHVSLADLYQLILDGHLQASVQLINVTYAIKSTQVFSPQQLFDEYQTESKTKIEFDKHIEVLQGVWDLAMFGSGVNHLRTLLHSKLGEWPDLTTQHQLYLLREGYVYQVLNNLPLPVNHDTYDALATRLNSLLKLKGSSLDELMNEESGAVMDNLDVIEMERVMVIVDALSLYDETTNCTPQQKHSKWHDVTDVVPLEQCQYELVIRTEELNRFIHELSDKPVSACDKPLDPRERTTLLTIIGALCNQVNINPKTRGVASSVEKMVEQIGVKLSNEAIRNVLMQVDDAIEKKQM
ncbi:hypothetical protein NM092_003235 [Vibrio cholerae]|nr:hypothetical protein [Vibrio cholerae]EHP5029740.1 hypothetical protein [Vibrio cholerae]EJL7929257.1 hypothetical protein [Vibrio cholerae]